MNKLNHLAIIKFTQLYRVEWVKKKRCNLGKFHRFLVKIASFDVDLSCRELQNDLIKYTYPCDFIASSGAQSSIQFINSSIAIYNRRGK